MSANIIPMFCHIEMTRGVLCRIVILLSIILLFLVPCGMYLNSDEDVDSF